MIKSFTVNKDARRLAKKLLAEARDNEPQTTADLQAIAAEVSAEMVGLENKFKGEISLIRKLVDAAKNDLQKLQRKSKTVNDVLRYTFVLPIQIYSENYHQTLEKLRELGYQIPEHRIWNAWQTIGERFDKGYRGINITVISSQNQKFELQFHTEGSFRLKTATHYLYEELRRKDTLRERKTELIKKCINAAENVQRPKGV